MLTHKAVLNRAKRDKIKPNSTGYTAIYLRRDDGDGELYAVFALENDADFDETVNIKPFDVLEQIEARLSDNGFDTVRVHSADCKFPQVFERLEPDDSEIVMSKHW